MAGAQTEVNNGILYVTGSLDRATDNDFQKALEKYAASTPPGEMVVDMSNVRWLAPTGAKALIMVAQDAGEKNGKLRVIASRHVMQTLNLLGAKSWLTIETVMTPNKPNVPPPPEAASAPGPSAAAPSAPAAPPVPAAPVAPVITETSASTPAPLAATEKPVSVSAPPASQSGTQPASQSGTMPSVIKGPLAGPTEELVRGAVLLRILHPNRRYSFHFPGSDPIMGIVRERVGGSWILVETAGTRKIVNLDMVQYCEIL